MMHRLIAGVLALICLVSFAGTGLAKDESEGPKFALGVRGDYADYQRYDNPAGSVVTIDEAAGFGVNATVYAFDYLSAQVSADHFRSKFNIDDQEYGDIQQTPLLFTLRFQPRLADVWMPYIGGGVGYYINHFDYIIKNVDVKLKDEFGYHAVLGVEVMLKEVLHEKLGMDFELRYQWTESEEDNVVDPEPFDINALIISGGLKIYF